MRIAFVGMKFRISLNNNFSKKVSISVKDCHSKPSPLSGSKEWDGILNGVEVSAVADLDQFSELNIKFNLWAGEEILLS